MNKVFTVSYGSSIKHNPSKKIHALLEQSGEKLKMTILPSEPIMMNA
jgi:hypothetical protein